MLNIPRLWYKKVDDAFAITSHDLGETLQKLNSIGGNIKLIMEKASEGNLPILDCIISLNEKREIITKITVYIENQLAQVSIPISHQINHYM